MYHESKNNVDLKKKLFMHENINIGGTENAANLAKKITILQEKR